MLSATALQALEELKRKWTIKTSNWRKILAPLSIHFEDRLAKNMNIGLEEVYTKLLTDSI
jgi:hypothetical protein